MRILKYRSRLKDTRRRKRSTTIPEPRMYSYWVNINTMSVVSRIDEDLSRVASQHSLLALTRSNAVSPDPFQW